MSDTTTRDCIRCGNKFDSIYQIDNGICDECREKQINLKNGKGRHIGIYNTRLLLD
jgi:DNA-directed RNA polymerase subunit RPC12/RpoP